MGKYKMAWVYTKWHEQDFKTMNEWANRQGNHSCTTKKELGTI